MSTAETNLKTNTRRSLAWQLGIFACLLLVVTSATLGWVGYGLARQILRDQIQQRLEMMANDRSEMLRDYVDRQKERVAVVASRTRLRTLVDEYLRGNIDERTIRTATEQMLRDAVASMDDLRAICLLSRDGRVLTTTDERYQDKDFSQAIAFERGRNQGAGTSGHFGEPFLEDDRLLAYITAPMTIRPGEQLAVVLAVVDVRRIRRILRAAPEDDSEPGGQLLVGCHQEQEIRYLLPQGRTSHRVVRAIDMPSMLAAIAGQRGFALVRYAGVPALLYYRPIALQPEYRSWGMVAKIDQSAAYQPLAKLRRTLVAVPCGLLLLGFVATVCLARRFTRPIEELTGAARSLAAGDLSARVAVRSRHNELGALVVAFNRMATKLHELNAELEQQVAARTAELATARDEAEAAHRALVSKAAELERSNNDLQQFAYVASHDLQEPLRAVTGFTELLQQRYADKLDEQANQFISFAVDGARRMSTLISNLLDYSRVGTRAQAFAPVDVGEIVKYALKNLTSAVEEADARVVVHPLPTVQGDKHQLARLFQNLIGNAIKFRGPKRPRIEISAEPTLDAWRFVVRDNGIGLKTENAERIFVVFQRLHSQRDYAGTGIGLAICQRIVERHGGSIWVESAEGQGSRFVFTLPSKMQGK